MTSKLISSSLGSKLKPPSTVARGNSDSGEVGQKIVNDNPRL